MYDRNKLNDQLSENESYGRVVMIESKLGDRKYFIESGRRIESGRWTGI